MYSTIRVKESATNLGIDLDIYEVPDISFITDENEIGLFCKGINIIQTYDVVVIRTFYPHVSEILTIARLFRDAGKLVVDESITDEGYAISKMHDYLILAKNQIPVPRTWQVYDPTEVENLTHILGYPCILKGVHGAHGTHVHLVENIEQVRECLKQYPPGEVTVQEFLPAEEDYRLLVIGYKVLPMIVSRKPYPGEFVTNSAAKAEFTARPLEEFAELKPLAEKAAKILRREFTGVDIRYRKNSPTILEVNRQPTFEGFEMVTKIDVASELLRYIESRFKGIPYINP